MHNLCIIQKLANLPAVQPILPVVYTARRDLALASVLFYSGNRGGVLGRIKGKDISRLDTGDILLHHREGKAIRDCAGQLVVVPRVDDGPVICPVTHPDAHMMDCAVHGSDTVMATRFGLLWAVTTGGSRRAPCPPTL